MVSFFRLAFMLCSCGTAFCSQLYVKEGCRTYFGETLKIDPFEGLKRRNVHGGSGGEMGVGGKIELRTRSPYYETGFDCATPRTL